MADDPIETHRAIGLPDMIEACRAEAARIASVQQMLVDEGMRAAPDVDAIRRRDVFDHTALLLERIQPHLPEFKKFIMNKRYGR